MLLGSVRIYDGARWVDTVPGGFVHVPPGGVHAFRNSSGAAAEILILFTPGAPREAYFEALAELAEQGHTLDDDVRTEFLRGHDQYEV